jgi:hypothetical protein
MDKVADGSFSRRAVVVGATGLAVGAFGVGAAQAQTSSSADPIDVEKRKALADASHSSQQSCQSALALSTQQLANGKTEMAECHHTCTNLLALTPAMHTLAVHGTAHPETTKHLARAVHKAGNDCADECDKWDDPVYKASADSSRDVAKHAKAVMES